jgi:hypothetical protein
MDKKKVVGLITGIIIVIAAISLIYVSYFADYTYTDSNIKITVPAQTHFTKNASANSVVTMVDYNSTDKNNINIRLLKINNQNITLFGTTINLFAILKNTEEESLTNASYEKQTVTNNYTIYYNKQKNLYAAIFFNDNMGVMSIIYCNDSKLIAKLAKSFELIGFTTEGLTVVNQNNTNSSTSNTTNTTTKTKLKTSTNTSSNQSTNSDGLTVSKDKIIGDDEVAPYHPGWDKQDYVDHGYRFSDPNAVG